MNLRPLVITGFIAAACLLWLPFHTESLLYATQRTKLVPAGPITAGFSLSQTVHPPPARDTAHNNAGQPCFAIRFATYQRTNVGSIDLGWQQNDRTEDWRVSAAELKDNTFRHFCPDAVFDPWQPFKLQVKGVDGTAGHSATLWLSDNTQLGSVDQTGALAGKAIAIEVALRRPIEASAILRIDRGAFLFGWICTVLAGVIALLFGFRAAKD